jgi:hypothetical protein
MIRLALAQPGTAVLSFDLCCATPVLPVATGRQCSPPPRLLPREAINAPRQQAASVQIPIASDAQLRHTSHGFLPWRFAYAGPSVRRATIMGPTSANLHNNGSNQTSSRSHPLDNVRGRRQTKRHERHRVSRNTPLIKYRYLFLNLLHRPDWVLGLSAG